MATKIFMVEAEQDYLDKIELILRIMQGLGEIGASREIKIFFDGDGRARIKMLNKKSVSVANALKEINIDKKISINFE